MPAKPNQDVAVQMEMKLMGEMFESMKEKCTIKCVPTKLRDSELSKAESVCLDRCVVKYMDVFQTVGRKMNEMAQQQQNLS